MNKPVVLVTGGAGYIGSHAVLALLDEGYSVVVLDNLVTGFRKAVDPRAVFIEGSIHDDPLISETIKSHNVSIVMHFAGSVVVPESISNPIKYYRNNTVGSQSLIESSVKCGISHFLFSSTAATYGAPNESPVSESTPTIPINPYGHSKLMTERMLADIADAYPFNFCALRYFNVAGADPLGRTGQSTAGATHLIKVAVEAATGKRSHVAVFGTDYPTPDGTCIRDYIHVSDLVEAHLRAMEVLIAQPTTNHVLNCGYGRGFSVTDVLDAVDKASGSRIERRMEARRAGDPPNLIADNRAILGALAWQPRRDSLDQIVADALAWERKCG